MEKKSAKLQLSRETLLSLDDQDLAGVVGGTLMVDTVVCHSGVCNSGLVCQSAFCGGINIGSPEGHCACG